MRTLTQHLLPHKIISLIAHMSANCKIKFIKNYLIGYFIKRYAVNMQEAIEPNPFAYACYNDFFTRQLKAESRPIDENPKSIVSPADGALAQFGAIRAERILQAKGHTYSAKDLVGGSAALAAHFINGSFATVYLAPKDYHRVHMPFAGRLSKMIYVPGKLFSVNDHAAENIPNVFARNERVVCIFETTLGKMAVVLVGAMIVGGMETVWAGTITPPHGKQIRIWDYTDTPEIYLEKGAEMGRFKLGSTVILLFGAGTMAWNNDLSLSMDLKFGQRLADKI